ncbi:phosphoenolpyruvate--protein phosphotransferase [Chitinasiproducens palmae]|uniref:Phosphoenolpyruvate-protein phosphotransferase n=1 Tax=Chitinasiproducens palmae TaxID=1770053 RepID=A0A1H2PPL9_9BURK|nr:phosphoenolpyruvate--protein phosphotransferase [Chitinasiproducens palmae]SDV48255.1 phosphoenolpyruvate--protein phosphotransferase [Chitinasiproducens palmae]
MSFTLHGISVSRGVAIGRAYLIGSAAVEVDHYLVSADDIDREIGRFFAAQAAVIEELDTLRADLPDDAPGEMSAFLSLHALLLRDPMLVDGVTALIRERRYNAEWALTQHVTTLLKHFNDIEDEYLRERRADIEQVGQRVLKVLAGLPTAASLMANRSSEHEMIVVAHDIAPADMLQFRTQAFSGFVTDLGGRTSHTAIVARSFGIPAAVGVKRGCALIRHDDIVIIDGDQGVVIVDPAPSVLKEYECRRSERALEQNRLQRLRTMPATTQDGHSVALLANIELPQDAVAATRAGAAGVGLFRTEFLFMNRQELPGEEEQVQAYRRALEAMQGLPVTIRTIDVGADKPLDGRLGGDNLLEADGNPALGLRAIRWCLSQPEMFLTQLRAILRASVHGPVRILVPMLAHASEIDQTLALIAEAKSQCDAAGIAYDRHLQVGAMIEIPAAALALPLFLNRVDFLSIGTNDLIQYTLAIDRADNAVAHLYDPMHPAVLHLIASVIDQAKAAGVPVAVCGEMAGDASLTRLLLGMGLTEFSMHPSQLLHVKQEVLRADCRRLVPIVRRLRSLYEPAAIQAALAELQSA